MYVSLTNLSSHSIGSPGIIKTYNQIRGSPATSNIWTPVISLHAAIRCNKQTSTARSPTTDSVQLYLVVKRKYVILHMEINLSSIL